MIERFAVHLVSLDPVIGAETAKTRPCVVVSPDEMNDVLATVTRTDSPPPRRNV